MNNLRQDLQYGFRTLWNQPGFTAAAILVLALGLGANSAVFSLVNAFLLKPLHVERADQLRGLYSRDVKHPDAYRGFSYPNYTDIRGNNPVFSSLMAHTVAMVGIKEGDTTRRTFASVASSNYFATLGVSLLRGRTFMPEEEKPGNHERTVIVSYSYWNKVDRDPRIIGKQLRFNERLFTVVGIAPEGFTGTTSLVSPEFFFPLGVYSEVMNDFEGGGKALADRTNSALIVVGRLKPDVTQEAADARLAVLASQMEKAFPAENKDQTLLVRPLSRMSISTNPTNDNFLRIPELLLLSLSGVVLIIASFNLANMMMVRGAARRKEIAIRLAIGGGRGRIVRQLLTEGLLIALLGGAAGLVAALWSTRLLIGSLARLAPIEIVYDARPDARVLLLTLGFCALSVAIFALFPAWKISNPDVWFDLKDSTAGSGSRVRRLFSPGNLLVMGQLSLSLMMLTAAGLFVHSAVRASNIQPGFALDHEILVEVDGSLASYDPVRGRQVYAALRDRLRQLPGVQSVGLAATVPFGMMTLGRNITAVSGTPQQRRPVSAGYNMVTPDYFQTIGIPLLQGRSFLEGEAMAESKARVAILDKMAATKLWPVGDALGKRIRLEEGGGGGMGISASSDEPQGARDFEVVGVVGNVRDRIVGSEEGPHVYVPFGPAFQADVQIHLRTAGGGAEADARVLEAVRREIRAVDEHLPVLALKTMRGHLESGLDFWIVRTGARMLEVFGAVALFLAVVGLYAVNAYTVARRTREIGIRMALGADASGALRLILGEGMRVTAIGLGVGLLLAAGIGKVLAGILYGVPGFDPLVLAAVPVVLAVVALLACYLPARRASRIDPMIALRCQ